MSDRVKNPFPRPVDVPTRFMDQLTLKDLARLGIPATIGIILTTLTGTNPVIGVTAGALIGGVLVAAKIQGEKLDVHLFNYASYLLGTHTSSWPQIQEIKDDVAVLDNGTTLGVVQVSPCELDMLSRREQQANIGVVHDLLKTLEYPVEIHSQQHENDLSHLEGCKDTAVTTQHYIIVKTTPETDSLLTNQRDNETDLKNLVSKRCTTVRNQLIGANLHAEQVTGDKLQELLQEFYFDDVSLSAKGYTVNQQYRHRRLITVSEFPRKAQAGWLADILKQDGLIDTIQVIQPVTEKQRNWLSRTASRLTAELSAARSPRNRTELRRAKQDAEDMLDAEINDELLVNYGVYIIAKAETPEELKSTLDKVKTRLRSHRIKFQEPFLRTHRAVKTDSIYTSDQLRKTQIVPGKSAATSFSFNTSDNIEENGILIGKDNTSSLPIVLNRFSWEAPHTARMGKTGSGKTFHKSLEILRQQKQKSDLQIHIIDPKPDYKPVIETLDGETQVIDKGLKPASSDITRYVVSDPEGENSENLAKAVRHIYHQATHHNGETIVVVDEAHRVLKNSKGRAALEDLIREGRSKKIGVDLITQNASDLTNTQEGRNILKNVDCLLFFKHQELNTGVTQFFNLTSNEAQSLHKLKTGDNLPFSQALIREPINTKLRIEATEKEQAILQPNTKPEDSDPEETTSKLQPDKPEDATSLTENPSPDKDSQEDSEDSSNEDFQTWFFLPYGILSAASSATVLALRYNLISYEPLNLWIKLGVIGLGQLVVLGLGFLMILASIEEVL